MTQPLPQKIIEAMPSDNEMVIGTVVSGNPLVVNVRGGEQSPGRLSTAALAAGDPVLLLRQEATWAALGKVISGNSTGFGLTGLYMSASNAILNLTAVEQDVPGTSITFTTTSPAANVVAIWFGDYDVSVVATATGVTMLRIDGVTLPAPAATYRQATAGDRGTTGQADLRTVPPGTHTAILRANRSGGLDLQLRLLASHTTLLLAVFE